MHTLTARGWTLLLTGMMAFGFGWGLGQPAVITVAVLLILVPTIGAITVRRTRLVLGSSRSVRPSRFAVGGAAEVVLTVENRSRFPSGLLLLQDLVPAALGDPARTMLDRVPSRGQQSERYLVQGRVRGRTSIGPLSVTVTDPFGTATVARSFEATSPVLVTPAILALGGDGPSAVPGGRGETVFRALAARGDNDVLPREHRPGDDMRRIHWRATARSGEVMVRREERAWHSSITVMLDDRERAHHGSGRSSTFEWAVSAAASVAVHYLTHGWRVTAVTTTGQVLVDPTWTDLDTVLQAFSDVHLIDSVLVPATALDGGEASAVVAVIGRITEESVGLLGRPTAGFAGCLLLDPGPVDHVRAQGWRTTTWSPLTPLAEAWAHIVPVRIMR